jgi:hypothetical protein
MESTMSMTRPQAIFSAEEMAQNLISPPTPSMHPSEGIQSHLNHELLKHPVSDG